MNELRVTPCLMPHGRLVLAPAEDAVELESGLARRLREAFTRGAGHGLLRLGAAEVGQVLPPVFSYWRELGVRYVTSLCTALDVEEHRAGIPPILRGAWGPRPAMIGRLEVETLDKATRAATSPMLHALRLDRPRNSAVRPRPGGPGDPVMPPAGDIVGEGWGVMGSWCCGTCESIASARRGSGGPAPQGAK